MQNPTEPRPLDQLDLRRRFDTKIAILLRDDLESWQRLNAAAFLASGIAASDLELIGEPYADAVRRRRRRRRRDGVPRAVPSAGDGSQGSKENLTAAHRRALSRHFQVAVFTADMFETGHDEANRAACGRSRETTSTWSRSRCTARGNAVDKTIKGARLHP